MMELFLRKSSHFLCLRRLSVVVVVDVVVVVVVVVVLVVALLSLIVYTFVYILFQCILQYSQQWHSINIKISTVS